MPLAKEGVVKLCICMQYAIKHYGRFSSVKEMYEFFFFYGRCPLHEKYGLFALMNLLGMDSLPAPRGPYRQDQQDNYFIYYSFQKTIKISAE